MSDHASAAARFREDAIRLASLNGHLVPCRNDGTKAPIKNDFLNQAASVGEIIRTGAFGIVPGRSGKEFHVFGVDVDVPKYRDDGGRPRPPTNDEQLLQEVVREERREWAIEHLGEPHEESPTAGGGCHLLWQVESDTPTKVGADGKELGENRDWYAAGVHAGEIRCRNGILFVHGEIGRRVWLSLLSKPRPVIPSGQIAAFLRAASQPHGSTGTGDPAPKAAVSVDVPIRDLESAERWLRAMVAKGAHRNATIHRLGCRLASSGLLTPETFDSVAAHLGAVQHDLRALDSKRSGHQEARRELARSMVYIEAEKEAESRLRKSGKGSKGRRRGRGQRAAAAVQLPPLPPPTAPAEPLAERLWTAAGDANRSPGRAWLAERHAWPPRGIGPDLPPAVRWMPREAAPGGADGDSWRGLPDGAAGALVFAWRAPGESVPGAVHVQPVPDDGDPCTIGGTDGRTFTADRAGETEPLHVADDPIEALAVAAAPWNRGGVVAARDPSPDVLPGTGPVILHPDADRRPAAELDRHAVAADGRQCRIETYRGGRAWGEDGIQRTGGPAAALEAEIEERAAVRMANGDKPEAAVRAAWKCTLRKDR